MTCLPGAGPGRAATQRLLLADGGDGGGSESGADMWWPLAGQVPWQVWLGAVALLLVMLAVALLTIRHVWRRSRREGLMRPDRVGRGLLALQARALPEGPGRDAADLRRRLARDLTRTRAAVSSAAAAGTPLGGLSRVIDRLERASAQVDARLAQVQNEPQAQRRAAALAAARPAAQQVLDSAGRVRAALYDVGAVVDEPGLRDLRREVDEEVEALDSYLRAYRELGGTP